MNGSATHELLAKLTSDYPKMGKFAVPRWGMEPVHVTMSASLQHIIAVDRDKQSVSWRGYIQYVSILRVNAASALTTVSYTYYTHNICRFGDILAFSAW